MLKFLVKIVRSNVNCIASKKDREWDLLLLLGPIGPLELGLVCVSEVLLENVHWGPLDDSRMGNGEWGIGNGD